MIRVGILSHCFRLPSQIRLRDPVTKFQLFPSPFRGKVTYCWWRKTPAKFHSDENKQLVRLSLPPPMILGHGCSSQTLDQSQRCQDRRAYRDPSHVLILIVQNAARNSRNRSSLISAVDAYNALR